MMQPMTAERLANFKAALGEASDYGTDGFAKYAALQLIAEVERLQKYSQSQGETITEALNAAWAILYPDDPGGWEYPIQVARELRIEVERMQEDNTKGYVLLAESQRLLREAQAKNKRLQAALGEVEWEADGHCGLFCPWCGEEKDTGHAADCQRQEALGITEYGLSIKQEG